MELEAGAELDARICALLEPQPAETISARELRAQVRNFRWVSSWPYPSPEGWWAAEIGTDHGPPEDDEKPVQWRPARYPTEVIEDAWLVVEELHARGEALALEYRCGVDPSDYSRFLWVARWRISGARGVGTTAPLAICRATVARVEKREQV